MIKFVILFVPDPPPPNLNNASTWERGEEFDDFHAAQVRSYEINQEAGKLKTIVGWIG